MQPEPEQWRKETYKFDPFHAEIAWGVIAIIISILFGRSLFQGDEGYWSNVYMTVIGVAITILVLNRQAERREEQREEREIKKQLLRDAKSQVNDVAKNAIHQIRERGWLEGDSGLLQGADLQGADLQGAQLGGANLQGVNLEGTNLQGANLMGSNLIQAFMIGADLRKAKLNGAYLEQTILSGANLQGADLLWADLQDAHLSKANLQGVQLLAANLQGARLTEVKFDEKIRLPDDSYWTPTTDMAIFTDPGHKQFWLSEWIHRRRSGS